MLSVPEKLANKGGVPLPAELAERRGLTRKNTQQSGQTIAAISEKQYLVLTGASGGFWRVAYGEEVSGPSQPR